MLVYIDEYGLLGSNFYYQKGKKIGMTKEQLEKVELFDDRVLVHKDIIKPLLEVDKIFQKQGYRIYITEGYRSKKLYHLINEKMKEELGEEGTKKILNMKDMPHSTGKSVDISLHNQKTKSQALTKNPKDGIKAYFINYYKDSQKEEEKEYYKLQQLMIKTMIDNGFELGTRKEYFHFNYADK